MDVTMHGIYRRLLLLGRRMETTNLSDILLEMIDRQTGMEIEEESRVEMQGQAMYDVRGRAIQYGVRTKAKQHRTPDSFARDQRIKFDDDDRETAEREVNSDLDLDKKNIRTEDKTEGDYDTR